MQACQPLRNRRIGNEIAIAQLAQRSGRGLAFATDEPHVVHHGLRFVQTVRCRNGRRRRSGLDDEGGPAAEFLADELRAGTGLLPVADHDHLQVLAEELLDRVLATAVNFQEVRQNAERPEARACRRFQRLEDVLDRVRSVRAVIEHLLQRVSARPQSGDLGPAFLDRLARRFQCADRYRDCVTQTVHLSGLIANLGGKPTRPLGALRLARDSLFRFLRNARRPLPYVLQLPVVAGQRFIELA